MISYNRNYIDLQLNNKKFYEIFLYYIDYIENKRELLINDVFDEKNPIFNEYKNLKNFLKNFGFENFIIFKVYPCELYTLNVLLDKYHIFQIFPFYKENVFFSKQKTEIEIQISKIKTNKALYLEKGLYFLKNDDSFRVFMSFY